MKRLIKYPSTSQFREVVGNVKRMATFAGLDENNEAIYNELATLPKITFTGSVKLHGTNAAVSWIPSTNEFWAQSRENIITPEKDNAGFAQFAHSKEQIFKDMIKRYFASLSREYNINYTLDDYVITIYGEWAGKGIQKGVGISEVPKSFFIFGLKLSPLDPETEESAIWVDHDYTSCSGHGDILLMSSSLNNIWNVSEFKQYKVEIDFNDPQRSVNEMIALVEEVENSCPVSKDFGIENGVGEGIVWVGHLHGTRHLFKTKGEKHQSSRVKTLVAVDMEKLNSVKEFIDYAVTENRLNQGIEQVFTTNSETPDIKKTGDFIKWISNDVIKEELDTLTASGLEVKDVGGAISKKAADWYKKYLMANL